MSKIEGQPNLIRDDSNMAIINKDTSTLIKARMLKERYRNQESEINTLREEVQEMKQILLQINEKLQWQQE
jgi:hypothetical protein|tara:strand:- start:300 stop:512 length:213 start_codon:yes stop_codon:yes gene_type:complete